MRRVVVTGLGMISPLGNNVGQCWQAALEGKSGVGLITKFDSEKFATKIAAEVKNFDPLDHFDRKRTRQMDTFIQYAVVAAREAVKNANLTIDQSNEADVGVIIGVGLGGLPEMESAVTGYLAGGPRKISPFFIPRLIANLAGGQISIDVGAKGPNCCHVTACAASSHAIGDAYNSIKYGETEAVIAGGSESTITPLGIGGFNSMKALSTRNDEPQRASRPFDKDRDGFIVGEGSGILILESLAGAKKRGAKIIAEIAGYGRTGDAYHISAPEPTGSGAVRAMQLAIKTAGLKIEDVDYINAHGTSTKYNDVSETNAIKKVFGEHAKKLKISSTKSVTGHLLGAAAGIEAVFTSLAVANDKLPPTINLENPDPECDLDYVPQRCQDYPLQTAISNSFGFGGTNGCLLFKKYQGD